MTPLARHVEPTGFVALPDGRVLAYSEFGEPHGYPVVNCHGSFVGRLDIAAAEPAARRLGIRIISPDRPGTGGSTRARGRVIAEWADDVRALLDALDVERCAGFGWSLGGPFAAALAALLPDRVQAVTIVAGVVPLDWPWEPPDDTGSLLSPNLHLADKWPGYAWLRFRVEAAIARRLSGRWWTARSRSMSPADVDVIEGSELLSSLVTAVSLGLRRPGGAIDDCRAIDQPWGFAYESIAVPVRLWHGADDPLVPSDWSREARARIRGSSLVTVEASGHFVAWSRFEEILFDLLAARTPGRRPGR
ncbi:MAG TPA: alpha/beta hydrolase [Acidimicrobiales bacterium]|nr:alpha/beta hydrolase [Acidimicrobiales bacterium]